MMNRYSIMSAPSHRRRPSSRMSISSEPEHQLQQLPQMLPPRRLSLPGFVSLPSTPAEWSRIMAEAKRHFINRRFRQCSALCSEILDNVDHLDPTEPARLIYLHFYAAAALEQTLRTLPATASTARTNLLREARAHYCRADELAQAEDDSVGRSSRRSSAESSYSADSSTGSVSSRATTVSSRPDSVYSCHTRQSSQCSTILSPPAVKKRVTFMDPPQEPILRPDSPTLGFDDYWTCGGKSNSSSSRRDRSIRPDPLTVITPIAPIIDSFPAVPSPEPSHEELSRSIQGMFLRQGPAGPFARYGSILGGLRSQIATHISTIDSQLAQAVSAAARGSGTGMTAPACHKEPMRDFELRARIERLRSNGWKRPRFDAKRYEVLRENALAELS